MSDDDARLLRTLARFEGVTPSELARTAILEKIENAHDLKVLREAIAEDPGERFGIDEVLRELS